MAVRQMTHGKDDHYRPEYHAGLNEWRVKDATGQFVAGPYTTEVQAVYVAAILTAKPTATPFAPDPEPKDGVE